MVSHLQICLSLTISEIEHLPINVLTVCFVHFQLGHFSFLLCMSSLCIIDVNYLLVVIEIFALVYNLSFDFVYVTFYSSKI